MNSSTYKCNSCGDKRVLQRVGKSDSWIPCRYCPDWAHWCMWPCMICRYRLKHCRAQLPEDKIPDVDWI